MTENNRPPCIKNMHSQSNFGYTEIPSVFSSHCNPVIDIGFVSSVRFYTVYAFLLWLTMRSLYQCNIFLSFIVNGCIRTKFSNRRQTHFMPGRVAQSVGHLTRKSGVLGSIPGLATYFRFSFRFFKKGSCQLLVKVCARSTG